MTEHNGRALIMISFVHRADIPGGVPYGGGLPCKSCVFDTGVGDLRGQAPSKCIRPGGLCREEGIFMYTDDVPPELLARLVEERLTS